MLEGWVVGPKDPQKCIPRFQKDPIPSTYDIYLFSVRDEFIDTKHDTFLQNTITPLEIHPRFLYKKQRIENGSKRFLFPLNVIFIFFKHLLSHLPVQDVCNCVRQQWLSDSKTAIFAICRLKGLWWLNWGPTSLKILGTILTWCREISGWPIIGPSRYRQAKASRVAARLVIVEITEGSCMTTPSETPVLSEKFCIVEGCGRTRENLHRLSERLTALPNGFPIEDPT